MIPGWLLTALACAAPAATPIAPAPSPEPEMSPAELVDEAALMASYVRWLERRNRRTADAKQATLQVRGAYRFFMVSPEPGESWDRAGVSAEGVVSLKTREGWYEFLASGDPLSVLDQIGWLQGAALAVTPGDVRAEAIRARSSASADKLEAPAVTALPDGGGRRLRGFLVAPPDFEAWRITIDAWPDGRATFTHEGMHEL